MYFPHYKENNTRNIFHVLMFQQFLAYILMTIALGKVKRMTRKGHEYHVTNNAIESQCNLFVL